MRIGKWLGFLFLLFLFPSIVFAQEQQVRVRILQNVESVRLTFSEPFHLEDPKSGKTLREWKSLPWVQVVAGEEGIRIGQLKTNLSTVILQTNTDSYFRVNSQPYRGGLILMKTAPGKMMVINRLLLERYLVGALTSETSSTWPIEVLKAHAIVSRTMVAHRIWLRKDQPFDVTADTSTHLYYGVLAERPNTQLAVRQTAGQVLTWEDELFSTTFHANCGGHTENAAELWEMKKKLPPLEGVEDPYCRGLKHFSWETSMTPAELIKDLKEKGSSLGSVKAIEILEKNSSGRVRSLRLQGTDGSVVLTGEDFRDLLGFNHLRSLNFTASFSGEKWVFKGFGWGHGVGFCQWGGYGMAIKGMKTDEILGHYFPGAKKRPLKGLPGFEVD
jgi:stage II sporulation protein D